ncbi:GNAT family N-acetyltransferase [Exiguobacterium flavidum]|uniref:GNAT family N-acetyltransferase n=1 Tax=Exiguobacterium flavidum TaxID=2184695 RepID=UPI000DF7CCBF|nr:GNAT family N-acetyltransferase [Exiguobacterium flavidum]
MSYFTIERVTDFDAVGWLPLLSKSEREGYNFIERMLRLRRTETFQGNGEAMFVAVLPAGQVIGCGGYSKQTGMDGTGRVRHLYVIPEARGTGTGSALLKKITDEAFLTYDRITLYTDDAAHFYEELGFKPVEGYPKVTHIKEKN